MKAFNPILVVSDRTTLARVIVANLPPRWPSRLVVLTDWQTPQPLEPANWPLIILAVSQPDSEPLIILQQTGLLRCLGLTPTLIISDRPFRSTPEGRLWHLTYPFTPEQLNQALVHLLPAGVTPPTASASSTAPSTE